MFWHFSKSVWTSVEPFHVKNIYVSKREIHKCYIALFTYGSTRAVHLELTPDLSANSFLRVRKRFFGRRGFPTVHFRQWENSQGRKGEEFFSWSEHRLEIQCAHSQLVGWMFRDLRQTREDKSQKMRLEVRGWIMKNRNQSWLKLKEF